MTELPAQRKLTRVPEAVTFDFWDTLVMRSKLLEDRVDALHRLLVDGAGRDPAPPRKAVAEAVDTALREFNAAWAANMQYSAADAVARMLDVLGVEVNAEVREQMIATIRRGDPDCRLVPEAADALRRLKDAGVRLGVISDVGWTPSDVLRSHLGRGGVLELFDHFSFSDEVGYYKPAPEIFRDAHAGLGVENPSRAAHIGDLRRTDVAGARAYGIVPIRFAGVFDDLREEPDADFVITSHAELPNLLGIG